MSWLNGKKTYIISFLVVFISLIHLFTGDLTLKEFLNGEQIINLLEAMGLSTLRIGVSQTQKSIVHEVVKNINFPHAG
ncbi:MAG: hypothetical protein F3740_01845 [Nitrospinae bacterium]|nr:hypothetical protein [Nitrospinota bacterium]